MSIMTNEQVRYELLYQADQVKSDTLVLGEGSPALALVRSMFSELHDHMMELFSRDERPELSSVTVVAETFLNAIRDLCGSSPKMKGALCSTSTGDSIYLYFVNICKAANLPQAMAERLWRYYDPLSEFS